MNKITRIRLAHQAKTLPQYNAHSVLWAEVWEEARQELGISLHARLPEQRLIEIDQRTLDILSELGVDASLACNDPAYRRFTVAGREIYASSNGQWKQS